jgi:hypothetical protein
MAIRHCGGKEWEAWNKAMQEKLLSSQETTGEAAGSWSQKGDTFGMMGGRVMVTALSLLSLESYYRHVPYCLAAKKDK